MLKEITSPNEAYWIRNLIEWAAGEEEELKIEHVIISLISKQKPLARIEYGPMYRFVKYVPFFELASSKTRLSDIVSRWAKMKNGS
jgi:hypothetical protein